MEPSPPAIGGVTAWISIARLLERIRIETTPISNVLYPGPFSWQHSPGEGAKEHWVSETARHWSPPPSVGRSRRGASARCPTHSNPPGNPQTHDRRSPFCRYPPANQSPHPKGAGRERSTGRRTPCRCSQIRKCSQGGRQSLPQNRPHPDVARGMRRTSVEVLKDQPENAATQRTMSR